MELWLGAAAMRRLQARSECDLFAILPKRLADQSWITLLATKDALGFSGRMDTIQREGKSTSRFPRF